jgi:hypothetical protein
MKSPQAVLGGLFRCDCTHGMAGKDDLSSGLTAGRSLDLVKNTWVVLFICKELFK